MKRNLSTKCIHLEEDGDYTKHYGAISYPIYQTATYAHPSVGMTIADCRIQQGNI